MKACIPLFSHSAEQIIAWRDGHAVTAAQFLSDVHRLIPALPHSRHILNDCHDRYHFLVTLCACMMSGKISLLPSTRTAETIRQLQIFAADAACLSDQPNCTIDLPQTAYPPAAFFPSPTTCAYDIPHIEETQLVAYVFTSGSTGLPIPHRKSWGALVQNVQAEAQQLGLRAGENYSIVGTVPAQHMYGFESTILLPLANGFSLVSGQSFYPADICTTLAQVAKPRVLVTTPVHLRSLLATQLVLPEIELIVSAAAPLSPQLALAAEEVFQAPLREIYGSTETGQIAVRRPTASPEWTLFPNLKMRCAQESGEHGEKDTRMWISGGHVETAMPMNDTIELTDDNHFLLHGRISDLINIAGKRSSLAYLNHHLNAIPGVEDATFYMPPETSSGEVMRLQAFVVAPTLTIVEIASILRERIDAAFMPRPIYKVAQLPRNQTGKLPQAALTELSLTLAAAQPSKKN